MSGCRVRRWRDGDGVRGCARRGHCGHSVAARARRRAWRRGRRSISDPGVPVGRQIWSGRCVVRRRREVRGARNCANPGRGACVAALRSRSHWSVRRPSGHHDSRSVVAHRRRDEAWDFERAPCNATKGASDANLTTRSRGPRLVRVLCRDATDASRRRRAVPRCSRRPLARGTRPAAVRSGTCRG